MEFTYLTTPDAGAAALLEEYFAEREAILQHEGGVYTRRPADFSAGVLIVAHLDGEPAGLLGMRPLVEPGRSTFELKHLYTRPAFRGRGVGRALMREVESAARERGATDLVLDTSSLLTAAAGLYAAEGWAPTAPYNENSNADRWYRKRLT